jgi:hypothetical protein
MAEGHDDRSQHTSSSQLDLLQTIGVRRGALQPNAIVLARCHDLATLDVRVRTSILTHYDFLRCKPATSNGVSDIQLWRLLSYADVACVLDRHRHRV